MRLFHHSFFATVAGITLSGCVAVDPRVDRELPSQDSLKQINGKFSNTPSYSSTKMGFIGPSDLGEVLHAPYMGSDGIPTIGKSKVDAIHLVFSEDAGLTASLERGGAVVAKVTLTAADLLEVRENSLVVRSSGCGDADSIQKGCAKTTITMFINETGDLVVVDTGGGAGLIGPIPAGVYGKLMSIFPRLL